MTIFRPYVTPAFSLLTCKDRVQFTVMQGYLQQSQKWAMECLSSRPFNQTISLPDVHEDLGHTLVHYLYTGTYQTLKSQDISGDAKIKRFAEYKRNIGLYCVARMYGLGGLESLTKTNIENLGVGIPIFDLLDIAKDAYYKLSDDEVWFTDYLKAKIKQEFEADKMMFTSPKFIDCFGSVGRFDKALVKILVETCTEKIATFTSIGNKSISEEPLSEEAPIQDSRDQG